MSLYASIRRSLTYRFGRLYNSFYYGHSNNKYVMVLVFPSLIWYIRYRADTKLGYRLYIAPNAGGQLDYMTLSDVNELKDEDVNESKLTQFKVKLVDSMIWVIDKLNGTVPLFSSWKNGQKIYLSDDITVEGLKN